MNLIRILNIVIIWSPLFVTSLNIELIRDVVKTLDDIHHFVFFGCSITDSLKINRLQNSLQNFNIFVNLKKNKSSLRIKEILSNKFHPPSILLIDFSCENAEFILRRASELKIFNQTNQWIILDEEPNDAIAILNQFIDIGLNSQILYVNKTRTNKYEIYDIYSHGRQIGSPMNITLYGTWSYDQKLKTIYGNLQEIRKIHHRGQFNKLKLRGVIVLDSDKITTNEQVHEMLAIEDFSSVGVFRIIKYSAELVKIISDRLNFTINYRVTRGWSGRLGNTTYRLGLMGVVQRGEVDIAASPSLLRISRFNDLDFYHQSWNFDTGFIYLYSNLVKHNSSGGDFLAPFSIKVWIISLILFFIIVIIWKYFKIISQKNLNLTNEEEIENILLQSIAAVCQQGLDPVPKTTKTRIVAFSLIFFSLIMYNYYTSSVVGGLLSNNDPGIKNLEDLAKSHLTLSFGDIGYNRVVMTEQTNRTIVMKIRQKFYSQPKLINDITGFTTNTKAIPYIKAGTHAFHCEFVEIYHELAHNLNANEICNLRTVRGLLEHVTLAMILTKKSQYFEMFKIIMTRATEVGAVKREHKRIRDSRPKCQGALAVLPVNFESVLNAFLLLAGGIILSGFILVFEILWKKCHPQQTKF